MIERHCKPAHWRSRNSLLAALIAGCAAVAPATAGTIGIDSSGTLVIGAEASDPGLTLTGITDLTHFTLFDPSGSFDLVTSGCDQGVMSFSCNLSGFNSIVVIGTAEDDLFEFSGVSIKALFAGGDGNDHIIGTTMDDAIFGGAGDDLLFGSATAEFFGGPGVNSVFIVGPLGQLEPGIDLGEGNLPPLEPLPRPPLAVPEPSSMLLLLAGLGATVLTNFRVKRRALRYC